MDLSIFNISLFTLSITGDVVSVVQEPWALRALLSSLMIGLTCGVIGCFIVLRNMAMIGDALSHSILPGIFVAFLLFGYSTLGFFVGSVVAGVLTSIVITWIQQNVSTKNDAAIGIVFTVMFAIGVIGISYISNDGGVHLDLQDFLFGDVLTIGSEDLILTAMVTVYTLASIVILYRYFFITTFQPTIAKTMGISVSMIHYFLMLMLSFAVVSGLRSVGVILVVAMLITPASTALLISDELKKVLIISGLVGMLSAAVGMIAAIVFDMPPGPAMVVIATTCYFLAAFLSPQKGLVFKYLRNRNQRIKIEQEDILRQAIKFSDFTISKADLIDRLGYSSSQLRSRLTGMIGQGLVNVNNPLVSLTEKGKIAANQLVRAHRLWETYQVRHMGLQEGQIHNEADLLEHHLTEELLDEVDLKLGYPTTDPHGSPIPQKQLNLKKSILGQRTNKRIYLKDDQVSQEVESRLWELGLSHHEALLVKSISQDKVTVKQGNKTIIIPADLARKIEVKV